ncbi:HNH endonuclease [Escherichia coli]
MNESLSLKEAAALVGVHPQTLRRWIREPGDTFPLPSERNEDPLLATRDRTVVTSTERGTVEMNNELKFHHIKRLWYVKDGVIYTRHGNRAIKFKPDHKGYLTTDTESAGKRFNIKQHEAVFMFYYNRQIAEGKEIHHIDGNKQNNAIDNLIELTSKQHSRIHKYQIDDPIRGLYLDGTWCYGWQDDNGVRHKRRFPGINEAMIFRAEIEEPRRAELRALGLNCKQSGSGPTNGTIRKISRPSRTRQWRHRQSE